LMVSAKQFKYYSSLLHKKFRNEENKFIVEGKRILEEGLNSNYICEIIFITRQFAKKEKDFLNKINLSSVRTEIITNSDFKKISDTQNPQGIAAVFQKIKKNKRDAESDIVVCLEDISEPGNLGTIIRNCDWFGIKKIFLSSDCAELYNPKTIRASMGSLFHLNIIENAHLNKTLMELKKSGYKVLCSDIKGTSVFSINSAIKTAVIFSNEAAGPDNEILNLSDMIITIPKIGKAESLNVASASAVILAELTNCFQKA
jgi:RNA methyltransferase, TrmH family